MYDALFFDLDGTLIDTESLALASGLKPLVVTVMGGDVQPEQLMGRATEGDHRATKRILAEADLILSKSTALKADIARYGDYGDKIETVRWGIEHSRFARNPEKGAATARCVSPSTTVRAVTRCSVTNSEKNKRTSTAAAAITLTPGCRGPNSATAASWIASRARAIGPRSFRCLSANAGPNINPNVLHSSISAVRNGGPPARSSISTPNE